MLEFKQLSMSTKKFLLAIGLLLGLNVSANNETKIPMQMTNATVFASGAQLYHQANYSIKAGVSTIILENVAPRLNSESIQVKWNSNVVVLDTKFRMFTNSEVQTSGLNAAQIKQLKIYEDSVLLLAEQIKGKSDAIDVLNGSKQIILNNGAVKGQGKVNDSIELLQKTVEYYQKKLTEINSALQAQNKELTVLRSKEGNLQKRLKQFRSEIGNIVGQGVPQIVVTVQSDVATTGKLEVSYLVSDAGWTPIYDLHSRMDEGKVNLNYKAHVYQNTGLKWENVRLTLSTNNPTKNKTKPTLHPWYASFQQHRIQQQVRVNQASNMQLGAMYKDKERATSEAFSEVKYEERTVEDFTQMVNHGISAEFKINLPYTITSNNERYTVLVRNIDLTAKYAHYVVPKMEKAAFLVAQVNKLEELSLIPGKANIYFEGGYVGETYIDPSMLDDTLRLSLGQDPNIIVRRTYLKQDKKEKLVGSTVEKTEYYLIEVRNQKSTPIEVVIQDQIPLSQMNDVTIELIDTNKATFNEVTGLLQWRKTIKPRQSEQIKFGFKIKHPKDQPVYY